MADQKISELTAGTPLNTDYIPYVDGVTGTTKKALKSELKGDKGDTGAAGANGSAGATGAAGSAATIAVGTVTTGAAGSSAVITNVGSSSVAVFDFTIPRGDTGATGAGTGDVIGPASATDNAIARFDQTTGKLLQNSAATIADTSGDITAGKYNTVAISGSSTPTLAVTGTTTVSGSNTGDNATNSQYSGLASSKADLASPTFTGTVTLPTTVLGEVSVKLDPALSADGTWSGITEAGTGGETLAFGDLVYFKAADSKWWKTDANADATAGNVKIGICLLAGASTTTEILLFGKVRADAKFPTLTVGASAYIGETAGEIVVAQPTTADVIIRKVGFGNTADELYFNPDSIYVTHT